MWMLCISLYMPLLRFNNSELAEARSARYSGGAESEYGYERTQAHDDEL